MDTIDASEIHKLIDPQRYLSVHLQNNVRPDGRQTTDVQPVIVSKSMYL
jgi:exosome complex RNA-binding protein Rrp42 (RNase PH superfamily)